MKPTPKTGKSMRRKARRRARPAAAGSVLKRMIAAREAVVTDGALQVCQAVAAVTSLVTVDATKTPFTVKPPDLFERKFNDPKVAISNEQMSIFKDNLTRLLPQIAGPISQIADNADLLIGDVSDFVMDALLSKGNR